MKLYENVKCKAAILISLELHSHKEKYNNYNSSYSSNAYQVLDAIVSSPSVWTHFMLIVLLGR